MAKISGSTNLGSKRYKVQFYSEAIRTWVLPLLHRIEAGDYPSKAGRIIGLSKQHTQYYVRKLQDAGLLYKEKRSSVVFYVLTEKGTNLLRSCEGRVFPGELQRLDKCQIVFAIEREGLYPDRDFKKVEMVNWTALLGLELGVKVRHTTKSWVVHVPVIRGKNPAEIYGLAINLANRVAVALSKKYGVVLCEPRIVGGEVAVEDPVAMLFGRYFTVRTKDRKIDHSWNEGELEQIGKDAVIEYLQRPRKVKAIDEKLEVLTVAFEKVSGLLAPVLGSVDELNDPKRVEEGQRKLGEYTV